MTTLKTSLHNDNNTLTKNIEHQTNSVQTLTTLLRRTSEEHLKTQYVIIMELVKLFDKFESFEKSIKQLVTTSTQPSTQPSTQSKPVIQRKDHLIQLPLNQIHSKIESRRHHMI